MTTPVNFHGWKFLANVEETKSAYLSELFEGAESCDCRTCRNLVAQRESEYPTELCEFLQSVGVNPLKEAEVWAAIPLETGYYDYAGWWHFIGEVEKEGEARIFLGKNEKGESKNWEIQIRPGESVMKYKDLPESPIVQIEYFAHLPWVLDEVLRV